jgi:uncharacterized membrane protein HdeD (DUF308 family)
MLLLVGNWWAILVRGFAAVIFGLLALFVPGLALATLIYLFAFYVLIDGIFNIVAATRRTQPEQRHWPALLIEGIFSVIAGVLALAWPGLTAVVLVYLIAFWAIATGAMEILVAVRFGRQLAHAWLLLIAGVFSIVFGAIIAGFPGAGALALVLWIGAYALLFGILLIALGLRLRSFARGIEPQEHGHFPPHIAPGH